MPPLFARDSRGAAFLNGRRDETQRMNSDEGSLQEIELPYELPTFSVFHPLRPLMSQSALFLVPDAFPEPSSTSGVLLIAKSKSVTINSRDPQNAMCMYGRSFRVGWSRSGQIALPTFSSLRDATTTSSTRVVAGAGIRILKPLHETDWAKIQSANALSVLLTNAARAHPVHASSSPAATRDATLPRSVVSLLFGERSNSRGLSEEKCGDLIASLSAHSHGHLQDLIALFSALFGTSADKAFDNPREEARYQRELRRRKFAEWLARDGCGATVTSAEEDSDVPAQPWRGVLKELLRHRFHQAYDAATTNPADCLSSPAAETTTKYLALQGGGARYGKYFVLNKELAATSDLSTDVSQTLKLILGELEPFLRRPAFNFSPTGVPTRNPDAITWKQVLGIVFHHCCPPTASVKEVLEMFFDRVEIQSLSPHYFDATVDVSNLRNRDVIRVGRTFRDASALLLHAYATSASPVPTAASMEVSAQILHPNAFGYHGYDYFGPFVTAVLLRGVQIKRSRSYEIAEHKVWVGFLEQTSQFSTSHGEWAYGLLAAAMIEDDTRRHHAFTMLIDLHRQPNENVSADLVQRVCGTLGVNVSIFNAIAEMRDDAAKSSKVAPSMESNAKLMRALKQFSISTRKQR